MRTSLTLVIAFTSYIDFLHPLPTQRFITLQAMGRTCPLQSECTSIRPVSDLWTALIVGTRHLVCFHALKRITSFSCVTSSKSKLRAASPTYALEPSRWSDANCPDTCFRKQRLLGARSFPLL